MNKIIQITSGRGPAECNWVVAKLLKLFLAELVQSSINHSVLHQVKGGVNTTISSVSIQIEGEAKPLETFLKSWLGTIQWIGESEFRKNHKRKNWFVGVNEIHLSGAEFTISDKDIVYEATRAGGPGGQHVNKVSTAVRATHVPSGLQVLASNQRSQLQNKKIAKERLLNRLKIQQLENKKNAIQCNWQNHNELQRGNPIRVFRGSNFKSEFVSKKHKSDRQKRKNELRKINLND